MRACVCVSLCVCLQRSPCSERIAVGPGLSSGQSHPLTGRTLCYHDNVNTVSSHVQKSPPAPNVRMVWTPQIW